VPKWRKDSIFGEGPRVPRCREQRAQLKAKLKLQRRPGRLTIATAAIGCILVDLLGQDGRLDPSHKFLAELGRVSIATVKRALDQLREFGFLEWTRRLVRCGPRCEQTSNAYVLRVPDCEAHFARPVVLQKPRKEEAPEEDTHVRGGQVQSIDQALARIRAAMEQRLIREAADKRRQTGFAF
jgi:hypothetical protein